MKVLQNTIIIDTSILSCIRAFHVFVEYMRKILIRYFVTPSMFHKRFLNGLILLFLFWSNVSVHADTIDVELARQIAKTVVQYQNVVLAKSTSVYYIFTTDNNSSFVIVSNNGQSNTPILGYSESCGWFEEDMPPFLLNWLDSLEKTTSNLVTCSKSLSYRWANNEAKKKESIPILLTSQWHQDSPYNDLCPVIADGNIKTAAGCVAIAAAQVAYYWRKDNPLATSEDTPIFPYGKAPVSYSVPAGTEFQWDLMKDYYTLYEADDEKEAVARLIYIIGTSTYLQYGVSTGGQITDIINTFSKQFNLNAKYAAKKSYTQEEWELLIYDNLEKKQPVVYAGSTGDNGHAVVIDGYNADLNLFHFNFGWGGNGDGYYTIDDVSGMNGYAIDQDCVYDIYPRLRNISITLNVDNLCADTQGQIEFSISNNSTFDIGDLYLFVTKTLMYPNNEKKSVWHYDGNIRNDGSEYIFQIRYTPEFSGSRCFLILTDGEMNILAQKSISIQEGSAVDKVFYDMRIDAHYSVKGERRFQKNNSGIYIIKRNNNTIKSLSY